MNRREALTHARKTLADNNIDDASLEGEVLLKHTLGIDRVQLYSDLDTDLLPEHEKVLNELLARRIRGEPSAYITGHREFYGLDFKVNRDVLIPRPETELLVEKALRLAQNQKIKTIADIGTGCGAIAVSLAVNLPGITVYAVDVSTAALKVARFNCEKHGVSERVIISEGNMLEPLPEPVDMIIANLPYVREAELTNNDTLKYEPPLALDGGRDGLDSIRTLCRQAGEKLRGDGFILMETGQGQADAVSVLLHEIYPSSRLEVESDLAGIRRAVSMRLTLSVK